MRLVGALGSQARAQGAFLAWLAFGVLSASLMHQALGPAVLRPPPEFRAPVRVRAAPLPQPAQASQPLPSIEVTQPPEQSQVPPGVLAPDTPLPLAVAPLPVVPPVLLLSHTNSAPGKSTPVGATAAASAADFVAPVPATVEQLSSAELPVLLQPALGFPPPPPVTGAVALPLIENAPPPLAPPEGQTEVSRTFDDLPGGTILVLGLLLNDEGRVIDSKILLPSSRILEDMTRMYATRGQYWKDLFPALQPGESRWIEQRINHAAEQARAEVLP